MEHSPERELKLAATPDFRMPSIYGLVGPTVRQAPPERNDTTYYDTGDLRLARWGASLRHRPGEGWTVKLPAERDAPFLVRPEIVFEGNGSTPPAEAVELVRGFVRGEELHERVRMTTIRRRTEMHDVRTAGSSRESSTTPSRSQNGEGSRSSFRELEVEIGDETTPGLLDALVERLRQAGAGAPDQTAKYIRALGADVPLTPGDRRQRPRRGRDARVTRCSVRSRCRSIRLIRHDPVMRLDVDPEGVHQARVATRRLRSDLRTFRSLLDDEFASSLRDELGWLARHPRRRAGRRRPPRAASPRAAELPEADRDAAAPVLATLQAARDAAHAALLEALREPALLRLLDRLVDAANDPSLGDDAGVPASDVVPGLVRRPWHKLAKRVEKLGESPSDDDLHEIRIRTKRARYAAEAAAPIVGKPARAFAHAAAELQDVLGDLNDAVVAARLARRVGDAARCGEHPGSGGALSPGARSGRGAPRPLAPGVGGARGAEPPSLDVSETVRAAGGLVCRRREDGANEILLVHRPAYDDWSFPKGKLEPGEREEDAAIREVEEETGLRCRLEAEVATTRYRDARGRDKTVRYWLMTPVAGKLEAANEVDDARFVLVEDAPELLTYARDAELLAELRAT